MPEIQLKEIERADLARINQWRNDEGVIEHLGCNFRHLAEAVDEAWYEQYLLNRDREVRLKILEAASGLHIGNVQLTGIEPVNRSAEFGIFIGEKGHWSRGFGKAATVAMLRHGFGDLNLHRIHLSVIAENSRAIRLYESLGFVREGTLRKCVFKRGSFRDMVVMGLLKDEFRELDPPGPEQP